MGTNFSNFYFIKLHFCPLNNIIDSFKSIVKVTNFSTTFLEIVKVTNSYWFAFRPTTYIIFFLLTNNHSSHKQFVKKFVTLAFYSF